MKSAIRRAMNLVTRILGKQSLQSLINTLLGSSLISVLETLKDPAGTDLVVFDIGAHKGDWTKKY